MNELLRVEDLTVALPTRSGYAKAVDGMSFAVDTGEVMGIAGESGSGKTITALSLFGLLPHGARVTGSIPPSRIEPVTRAPCRSEEHTSELQSQFHLVCRPLLEKKKYLASKCSAAW